MDGQSKYRWKNLLHEVIFNSIFLNANELQKNEQKLSERTERNFIKLPM